MSNKVNTAHRRSIAFQTSQLEQLEKLARKKHEDVSKLVRRAVDEYLSIQANRDDIDFISAIIRQEVKAEIAKQANRLASMIFKVGAVTASNYFLAVRMMADVISPSMQEDFKDIDSKARKLGIDFMKRNGLAVIEYLQDDGEVQHAAEKIKYDPTRDNRWDD